MKWTVIALTLVSICTISLLWSIEQIVVRAPTASFALVVESISALVLVAAAYYAKTLVDTNKETETTRRTFEVINSPLVSSGLQSLTELLATHHSLAAAKARANTMVGQMSQFGWVATQDDELRLNKVSASYAYMSDLYSCGLLDWNLLRTYRLTIVTGFYVVEPLLRSYISNGIISDETVGLARRALAEVSPGLLQSMGLAAYTI
jgi:hypothetical protein